MARRSRFQVIAFILITVPIFTLVMVFGVEWSYVERISREELDVGDRSPDNNRKRAFMSPNNRSPLDLEKPGEKIMDAQIDPPKDRIYAGEGVNHPEQKHPPTNTSTGVFYSLGQQTLDTSDKAKLYELLRERKVHELRMEKSMREMWWYIRDRVARLNKGEKVAQETLESVKEQYDVMWRHLSEMNGIGGSDSPIQYNWEYWQRNTSQEAVKLMERRLNFLQNPPDCESAKKLICDVAKTCGFGCQIHHVTYCFIMAYATKRTLILNSRGWRYSVDGWDAVFQPISSTCTSTNGEYNTTSLCLTTV